MDSYCDRVNYETVLAAKSIRVLGCNTMPCNWG